MSDAPREIMSEGVRLHQAGQFALAQEKYRLILASQPENADALHLLGYATYQAGDSAEGLKLIQQAIDANGGQGVYHCNLGVVLASMNRHFEAIGAFKRALSLRGDFAEAYYNLGVSLEAEKRFAEAVQAYQAGVEKKPSWAEAHNNLGNALMEVEKYAEAEIEFEKATVLNPRFAAAWFNRQNALRKLDRLDEAIRCGEEAVAIRPIYPEGYNNLGTVYAAAKQPEKAIAIFLRAIEQKPDYAEAFSNLSNAYHAAKNYPGAIDAAWRAIALDPNLAVAHSNLAQAFLATDKRDEAMAEFKEAIRLDPKLPEAQYNLGMMLLRAGQYRDAWELYEWRWEVKDFKMDRQQFVLPMWNGEPLEGRGILLHIEQGFGDLIQFVRYVPLVAQRGGRVFLESHRELARLMGSVPGVERVIPIGPPPKETTIRCPLLSLPRIFQTSIETIPAKVPYLWFNPELAERWKVKLGAEKRLKVGLVWNGRPRPEPRRSVPFAELAPLAGVPGVKFVSLQFGEAAAQAKNAPAGMDISDWNEEITDFADTAALMANLDLIVTIDTAAAHLAGALGRPTWVLLCQRPDWRWLDAGSVCPWYPTARLFRQPTDGDWRTPMMQLAGELAELAGKNKS
jgi:tetratricopeptide (TPR) repeat protein